MILKCGFRADVMKPVAAAVSHREKKKKKKKKKRCI